MSCTTSTTTTVVTASRPDTLSRATIDGSCNLKVEDLDEASIEAFGKECLVLKEDALRMYSGEENMEHLLGVVRFSKCLLVGGCMTAGLGINPISIFCLSLYIFARWIIGHHCCHGGYSKLDKTGCYTRGRFGIGLLGRFRDWMDWWTTEMWSFEHNKLHHYSLNEDKDPDLVEKNVRETTIYFFGNVESNPLPRPMMFVFSFGLFATWKWGYYVPNLVKERRCEQGDSDKSKFPPSLRNHSINLLTLFHLVIVGRPPAHVVKAAGFDPEKERRQYAYWWGFLAEVIQVEAPYIFSWFVIMPSVWWGLMGSNAAFSAFVNMAIAEVFTNIHGALVVVPNHCGSDLYRFEQGVHTSSPQFYIRAVLGSADYATGNDVVDFLQGWLNYQVEHHMFADLSLLQYRYLQPRVKALCGKYGIPYIQESVFIRLLKTLTLMADASKQEGPLMRTLGNDSKALTR